MERNKTGSSLAGLLELPNDRVLARTYGARVLSSLLGFTMKGIGVFDESCIHHHARVRTTSRCGPVAARGRFFFCSYHHHPSPSLSSALLLLSLVNYL